MVSIKFVTTIVFLIQLHAHGLCDSKDDAQNALNLLYGQIDSASRLVSLTASNMWSSDASQMLRTINDEVGDGIKQFTLLVSNVTAIAVNYTNGEDCLTDLQVYLNASNYRVAAIEIENLVFVNQITSAIVNLQRGTRKYNELLEDFRQNCLNTESSCDGLSQGIIAEVDRVLPTIKKIPYQLFADIYLLNFRMAINWRIAQSIIMEDYHKVLESAALCLVYIIEAYNETLNELPQTPGVADSDILELYGKLVLATEIASSSSILYILDFVENIIQQTSYDYADTVTRVRNVTFTANNTVFDITKITKDLNITINCTIPDIQPVIDSTLTRTLNDYRGLLNDLVEGQYAVDVNKIILITKELESIGLQVNTCEAEGSCDYLSEKVISKTSELPLLVQKVQDSTAALLLRTIPAVWKSGVKAARELLEQLEVDIVNLTSCVQSHL